MNQRFFYCPKCGGALRYRYRGDRERLNCSDCDYIMYENPVVGVAVIVFSRDGRILLGRRSGSYRGLWCIPCGYVEYDEDVYEAGLHGAFQFSQPGVAYRGDLVPGGSSGRRIESVL